jgi:SAM-dependent methyltransferase
MNIAQRSLEIMSGFLKSYGPSNIKKLLWDKEFSGGKWNFIDNTLGDCVYPHLATHLHNGSILDLGCGPGNTANELPGSAYQIYIGVDISEAALDKARKRTEQNGRAGKNLFVKDDFLSYIPTQRFDVILFRESMYHVPVGKVKTILDRYAKYLKDGGVFVVRTQGETTKHRTKAMLSIIESEFGVVEKSRYREPDEATVLVFRPRRTC